MTGRLVPTLLCALLLESCLMLSACATADPARVHRSSMALLLTIILQFLLILMARTLRMTLLLTLSMLLLMHATPKACTLLKRSASGRRAGTLSSEPMFLEMKA